MLVASVCLIAPQPAQASRRVLEPGKQRIELVYDDSSLWGARPQDRAAWQHACGSLTRRLTSSEGAAAPFAVASCRLAGEKEKAAERWQLSLRHRRGMLTITLSYMTAGGELEIDTATLAVAGRPLDALADAAAASLIAALVVDWLPVGWSAMFDGVKRELALPRSAAATPEQLFAYELSFDETAQRFVPAIVAELSAEAPRPQGGASGATRYQIKAQFRPLSPGRYYFFHNADGRGLAQTAIRRQLATSSKLSFYAAVDPSALEMARSHLLSFIRASSVYTQDDLQPAHDLDILGLELGAGWLKGLRLTMERSERAERSKGGVEESYALSRRSIAWRLRYAWPLGPVVLGVDAAPKYTQTDLDVQVGVAGSDGVPVGIGIAIARQADLGLELGFEQSWSLLRSRLWAGQDLDRKKPQGGNSFWAYRKYGGLDMLVRILPQTRFGSLGLLLFAYAESYSLAREPVTLVEGAAQTAVDSLRMFAGYAGGGVALLW